MKPNKESILQGLRHRQQGQSIVLITIAMVCILGAAAIVIDVGRLYFAYQELKVATQAAALAGGSVLGNDEASQAIAVAEDYSATTGGLNANSNLTNVKMATGYPQVKCLTSIGIPCTASPADANALVVSETATVPTTFSRVFGIDSWPIGVTATASAKGGYNGPYNVAIVLDTTASMGDTDSDSQCDSSRLNCALNGIQTLLSTLSPCPAGLSSCGSVSNGNVLNAVDEVSLMVFPGLVSASDASNDTNCSGNLPKSDIASYNNSPAYQIVDFSSDYRSSDSATSLVSSSNLVKAVGGASGCSSLSNPGGEGTFYAGAIDAAQAQLVAEARPNTKSVMIVLSDGQANATPAQMSNTTSPYSPTCECAKAVTEAQKAAAAGTVIYSVAYGAESTGCSNGSGATDTAGNGCANTTITPCETMEGIASSAENFFSDYTASGSSSSCISASRPTTNLNEIFQEISEDLTVSRLIPNNAI